MEEGEVEEERTGKRGEEGSGDDDDNEEEESEDQWMMASLMGFSSFDSTAEKPVKVRALLYFSLFASTLYPFSFYRTTSRQQPEAESTRTKSRFTGSRSLP